MYSGDEFYDDDVTSGLSEPRAARPEPEEPFERCPVCNDTVAVRVNLRWLREVPDVERALADLPKVACGAPWHYINRAVRP